LPQILRNCPYFARFSYRYRVKSLQLLIAFLHDISRPAPATATVGMSLAARASATLALMSSGPGDSLISVGPSIVASFLRKSSGVIVLLAKQLRRRGSCSWLRSACAVAGITRSSVTRLHNPEAFQLEPGRQTANQEFHSAERPCLFLIQQTRTPLAISASQ